METDTVNQTLHTASPRSLTVVDRREALRTQLISRAAVLIGSAASRQTSVPGVTLYRYCAPTFPDSVTYEPSVALVLQGMKRVTLGRTSFNYDPSRFLLTSLDLPVTSQVIEASRELPYLCVRLKLDLAVVRELVSRGPKPVAAPVSAGAPAMAAAKQPPSSSMHSADFWLFKMRRKTSNSLAG